MEDTLSAETEAPLLRRLREIPAGSQVPEVGPSRPAPINAVISLLENHRPEVLQEIRKKYPEASQDKILKAGVIAGIKKVDKHLKVRIETSFRGITGAMEVCDELTPAIQQRLRRASKYRFMGQLLTIVGGASIFGTLAADFPKVATYAGAAMTLIGSAMPHVAQYLGTGLGPDSDLFGIFRDLVNYRADASILSQELELWMKSSLGERDSQVVSELITKSNTLCAQITELEAML